MKKTTIIVILFLFPLIFLNAQEDKSYKEEEVIYGRKHGMALTMIVLTPEKPNGKGVLSLVSGNWISSYEHALRWYMDGTTPFLENGYTVFLTMHSSNPRYDIAEGVADIKRAIQFVRYNAEKFNIDPNNIGITGSSAGGHLSLTMATSDDIKNIEST